MNSRITSREIAFAREIECALSMASLLNTHERKAFVIACLKEHAAEAKAEQRQMCADAVENVRHRTSTGRIQNLILNATGKSDEIK